MNNELIINGITYVRKEEPKAEEPRRIEGWIVKLRFLANGGAAITSNKCIGDDTKLIEIKDGERILSRDELVKAWRDCADAVFPQTHRERFLEMLGFDK
jgi:hypothetical protein